MIGRTISHYRITEKLGEGGMGVVYKAEDTKLERPVALKFLPAHLLGNEEVRKRFEREAKAAAALHHPNICPVYEIDEVSGKSFISMAFIEGESLDKKIAWGPLKITEALDIAQQVARGLDAAHEKGIFHRDIKPENIIVDAKGHTTIMDFGLAQLTEASRLTRADETMGTVAYMSPEQTEGSGTDHRTDIWSLGVVLYEMLTGQQPFKGDYDKAVMYSILNEEPEPITGLRTGVSMDLERITAKCLTKSLEERYQTTADVAVDLRRLKNPETPRRTSVARSTSHESDPKAGAGLGSGVRSARVAWTVAGTCLVAALVVAALYLSSTELRENSSSLQPMLLQVELPPEIWPSLRLSISPDGRWLAAFRSDLQLYDLEKNVAQRLADIDSNALASNPFWSPDSRFIGFSSEGRLRMFDVERQVATSICNLPGLNLRGGTWSRDGVILFGIDDRQTAGIYSVPALGGEPQRLRSSTAPEGSGFQDYWPQFLLDDHHFVFWRSEERAVLLGSLDQKDQTGGRLLFEADTAAAFVPPGYLVYVHDGTLLARLIDMTDEPTVGEPVAIGENLGAHLQGRLPASSSDSGVLVVPSELGGITQLVWVDRRGEALQEIGEPRSYFASRIGNVLRLSPDQRSIAVPVTSPGLPGIWIIDSERGVGVPVTASGDSRYAVWSPDSREIIFGRDLGTGGLYRMSLDGNGEEEKLPVVASRPTDWSHDGRLLLYYDDGDLGILPLVGDRRPIPFAAGEANEMMGRFSPDGHWIAYVSDSSGKWEVYLRSINESGQSFTFGPPILVSTDGGERPVWGPDGNELFYLGPKREVMSVSLTFGDTVNAGSPQTLFTRAGPSYDTRDGERFLITKGGISPYPSLKMIVNWPMLVDSER